MSDRPHFIDLDHAATTRLDPGVLEAMLPHLQGVCCNPSSAHGPGQTARDAVESARTRLAACLGARAQDLVFTSGGTESDNLAIRGVVLAQRSARCHVITSAIEHPAVAQTCAQLEQEGHCRVTYLPVDRFGSVDLEDLRKALTPHTCLVSIMAANNEVGTLQPLEALSRLTRARGILFHTDAVQAGGAIPLDVDRLGVDLLSLSAHKFHGPKGVGLLYVRPGTALLPQITGGGQESGLRGGTENVPGIVGMAEALVRATKAGAPRRNRMEGLRDRLIRGVLENVPEARLTGDPVHRLPGHASFVVEGLRGQDMVQALDRLGIAASRGSACSSCRNAPSAVLQAMGYLESAAMGALRLSLGQETTEAEIDLVLARLPEAFRALSRQGIQASESRTATPEIPPEKVFALGTLGLDFVSESRRANILSQIPRGHSEVRDLLKHLQAHPQTAEGLVWLLKVDEVPLYAIRPEGPFAAETYQRLHTLLSRQARGHTVPVALPGTVHGHTVLRDGQRLPCVVPDARGLHAMEAPRKAAAGRNLVARLTAELRNPGRLPGDRARNFAAMQAVVWGQVLEDAAKRGLVLGDMTVHPSPFCRPGSDCWEVKLRFFHPRRRLQQACRVYRWEVDVSEPLPVRLGGLRQWDVSNLD